MLWGYGRPPRHATLEDTEIGLRETFPELREVLRLPSHRDAAEWLLEGGGE
jgi:hypothetical protein